MLASTPGSTLSPILVWTDLEALLGISTAASGDDGRTWPDAQPAAGAPSDGSVDRPWLTYLDGTFYLLYNGDGNGHWRLRASEDGVTWRDHSTPGDGSYPGALVADPVGRVLYVGNGDKVWWSEDAGRTFTASQLPTEGAMTGIVAQRPAVDDAGTVYFAWSELTGVYYAFSKDYARTWSAPVKLSEPGTHVWPWPVGGAAGRLAVVWLGTPDEVADPTNAPEGTEWHVHLAMLAGADTAAPRLWSGPVGERMHRGAICLDSTFCEVEQKDRRLGDFISAAVGRDGRLHIGYGTTETGHSISSPGYIRQSGGPLLRG
jgi:hypothetical protein